MLREPYVFSSETTIISTTPLGRILQLHDHFLPGGLAGSLTSGGTTTTWVPLLDKDGSTIGLVNAAQTGFPPATTFTYDPSGVLSVSGLSNSFPFQYQGLEHEVSDPGNLYFNPSGNVYNPQIQRGLSQVGQQSWGGPPNGDGFGGFGPGHHGAGPQSGMSVWQDVNEGLSILDAAFMFQPGAGGEGINFSIPSGWLKSIWDDVFGGGGNSAPPIPRQMRHHRHPIYEILAISHDLTPTQVSFAGAIQLIQSIERPPPPELHAAPSGAVSFSVCEGLFLSLSAPAVVGCGVYGTLCFGGTVPACPLAVATCGTEIAGALGCYSQAHGGKFPGFGEDLPPGDRTPEAPTPPLQQAP